MADDQDTAAQAGQSTPPAKTETPSTNVPETVQPESGVPANATSDDQGKDAEQSSSRETGDQSGQEVKPSRVERRINQLLTKVKEVGQPTQTSKPSFQESRQQSYFTQEEIDRGEVDPNVLMQRINANTQAVVQKALQAERNNQQVEKINEQYKSTVREHQSDLEGVKDLDPDLEEEAVKEYEAVNYQINPFTGQREFVPAVKFSEIVAKINSRAEKLAQKMAERIAEGNEQYIKKVSSSQAVPSSGAVTASKTVKPETTDFSEFERAYSPRKS